MKPTDDEDDAPASAPAPAPATVTPLAKTMLTFVHCTSCAYTGSARTDGAALAVLADHRGAVHP